MIYSARDVNSLVRRIIRYGKKPDALSIKL
jgi:hypothetical protein